MSHRHRRPSVAAILLVFLYVACGPVAADTSDKYRHDRCRSAFEEYRDDEEDSEVKKARAAADKSMPILMAVFGDSIVWGQGLKDRDKFWCRTKQWLELKTRRHVREKVYAHAGAVIEEESLKKAVRERANQDKEDVELALRIPPQGEEVNVSFPTINEQVDRAAAEYGTFAPHVGLVLVDGCINDVNFRNLVNAENDEADIRRLTEDRCGKPMEGLLRSIAEKFPAAHILVTGYYPIIYRGLTVTEGGKKKQVAKGSADNTLTKQAFKTIGGARAPRAECEDDMLSCLGPLSRAWYDTSNRVLGDAVKAVNRSAAAGGRPRVHFAEMNFPPEYGFSTKQSMLWNIRFGATNVGGLRKWVAVGLDLFRVIDTNDDRWDERGRQCREAERAFRKSLKELKAGGAEAAAKEEQERQEEALKKRKAGLKEQLRFFEFVCRRGSIGHPSRFGAALYAQTVIGRLQSILPETGWLPPDVVE